jgi:hypothetical protein
VVRTSTISDDDLKAVSVGRCHLYDVLDEADPKTCKFGETVRTHWTLLAETGGLEIPVPWSGAPLSINWAKYRSPTSSAEAHLGVFSLGGEILRMTERCLVIGQHNTGGEGFTGEHTTSDGVCCDELMRAARESAIRWEAADGNLLTAHSWNDDTTYYHDVMMVREAFRLTLTPQSLAGHLVRMSVCDSSQ